MFQSFRKNSARPSALHATKSNFPFMIVCTILQFVITIKWHGSVGPPEWFQTFSPDGPLSPTSPWKYKNIKYDKSASDANVCNMKWANDSDIHMCVVGRVEVKQQWQEANSLWCLRAPAVPQNPLQTAEKKKEKSQRIISRAYQISRKRSPCACWCIHTVAYHMLTEAFTNCKNKADSLLGLELQESPLPLSDLCRHPLLGRQHRPKSFNDIRR